MTAEGNKREQHLARTSSIADEDSATSPRSMLFAPWCDIVTSYRVSSQIQFVSHVFPPSGENDCSIRADFDEIFNHM